MKIPFFGRIINQCTALLVGCALFSAPMLAHAYPDRPVTLVVNFTAGGPLDLIARIIAEHAADTLGQPIVVENKPGASGNIGAQHVARQKPDGHTLLLSLDTVSTVNPFIYADSGFDARDQLMPISMASLFNQVLLVPPQVEVNNFAEFIEYAKENDLMYGSAGIGAPGHLTMEMLKQASQIDPTHVPYQGNAPAVTALLSGEVDTGFLVIAGALPHVKAEKLLPLAVSGKERDKAMPDVPTIAELGIPGLEDFDVQFGMVLMAPNDTPQDVVDAWTKAMEKAYADETVRERIENLHLVPIQGTPEEARKFLDQNAKDWEEVIKNAGIKVD